MQALYKKILKHTILNKVTSKSKLAAALDMSKTGIGVHVRKLIETGCLRENGFLPEEGPGRLHRCLEIVPDSFFSCGITISYDHLELCLINASCNLLKKYRTGNPFQKNKNTIRNKPEKVIGEIAKETLVILKDAGLDIKQLNTIGISVPGISNPFTGTVIRSSIIHPEKNFPLAELLSKQLNIPVFVDDVLNDQAYLEVKQGAGKGFENMMFISSRSGASGLILNGEAFYGSGYRAGQTGAFQVENQGPVSGWGLRGTLSSYFSLPAFLREIKSIASSSRENRHFQEIDCEEKLQKAFKEGEPTICQIIKEASIYLGRALCNIATILPVDIIVMHRWLGAHPQYCLDVVKQELQRYVLFNEGPEIKVSVSDFEADEQTIAPAFRALIRYLES